MKYASLIVTFNRKKKLVNALNSVLNQTLKPEMIILIDNHSTDGTKQLLDELGFLDNPIIHYYELDQNYGGSGGYYRGVEAALKFSNQFEYLSFSDDDAYFDQNFFAKISQACEENPSIHAFTGTVKTSAGNIQLLHRRKIINHDTLQDKVLPEEQYNSNFLEDMFSFVGSVVDIKLISQIGLPHKDYFIYFDDTEYSLRVREKTQILNVSDAIVTHDVKVSPNSAAASPITWKSYYDLRNSMLMKRQHSQWPLLNVYFFARFVNISGKVLFQKQYRGIRKRGLYTYLQAYRDGMRNRSGKNPLFVPGHKLPY